MLDSSLKGENHFYHRYARTICKKISDARIVFSHFSGEKLNSREADRKTFMNTARSSYEVEEEREREREKEGIEPLSGAESLDSNEAVVAETFLLPVQLPYPFTYSLSFSGPFLRY
jgi:hypothetical protein